MKLRDKYPQLRDPAFIKNMVVRSVFGSMALENQTVSLQKLEELYDQAQRQRPFTPGAATGV
ncbi:hypothetical protein ABIB60_004222 [Hymenobacter sp. UYP22]